MHDHVVLGLMRNLAQPLDRPDYADAVDRYLRQFATRGTRTATGLFLWASTPTSASTATSLATATRNWTRPAP